MKNLFVSMLILAATHAFSQPVVEDFENSGSWSWAPWNNVSAPTSTKSSASAHSGSNGLSATGEWVYRTDVTVGYPGDVIVWWLRFPASGRAYCGFAATSGGGYCVCVAPNTSE